MHSSRVPDTSSTVTATSTSVTTSRVSQPESAAGQRQQGSFVGLSTTAHTPESTKISASYYQQDELRPLSDLSVSQTNPFDALATHQTVTFGDDHQGRSAGSLALSNEPARSQKSSQSVDDVAPIVWEEQSPEPTDKWIMMSGDDNKPFKCGFKSCGKKYIKKSSLRKHFVSHTGDSKFRCYSGNCTGTVRYRNKQTLTRHIHSNHTFERPFGCEICDTRFRRAAHLKYHREHVHFTKSQKKSPNPQSVSRLSSAATATTNASTSTITSGVLQPESAAGQRLQAPSIRLSTTVHTPELMQIPTNYQQQARPRLLAEVSTSQINPFEALATHQTVTYDDEAVTTGIAGAPNLPGGPYQAEPSPDPTDTNKWIIVDKSQARPYICGFPECDEDYKYRSHLVRHFIVHIGKSKYKCLHPECVGKEYFCDSTLLKRHIAIKHTRDKPFQCELCGRRFKLKHHLKYHMRRVHGIEEEKKSPKRKRK